MTTPAGQPEAPPPVAPPVPVLTKEDFERARWSRGAGLVVIVLIILLVAWGFALWRGAESQAAQLLDTIRLVAIAAIGLAGGLVAGQRLAQ